MTFILEIGQYFGTSQNGIEDKKNETEGVVFYLQKYTWANEFKNHKTK